MACEQDGDCDDGVQCTRDECNDGLCVARAEPDSCPDNGVCHPIEGCRETSACATDGDCEDDDPCTTDARCDPRSRTCTFRLLDGDNDGHYPQICGGIDCDDSTRLVPRATDVACDLLDNDCDGAMDEGLDLMNDPTNCGSCGVGCRSGTCVSGQCEPCGDEGSPCCGFVCGRSSDGRGVICTPLDQGPLRDDGCDSTRSICTDGTCEACGEEGQACCEGDRCDAGYGCVGGICQAA
jgi:hypothetical protein